MDVRGEGADGAAREAPDHLTLPNGMTIACLNAGEAGMLYHTVFDGECYARHGLRLAPRDVVLDVGANIGIATLFFHARYPGVSVHSFEPAPAPFGALAENRRFHRVAGTCHRTALSDTPGTAPFTYYPRTTVMSGFHADAEADAALTRRYLRNSGFAQSDADWMTEGKYVSTTVDTPVTTLSAVIEALRLPRVALLKIDVEKNELNVLQGLRDGDWPRVGRIVAEVHDIDGRIQRVEALLSDHGFQAVIEQDEKLRDTDVYQVTAIRADRRDGAAHVR